MFATSSIENIKRQEENSFAFGTAAREYYYVQAQV